MWRAIILGVLLLMGCASEPDTVIVITIDTLRAEAVGAMASVPPEKSLTPNIDKIAERGTRFARAYTTAPYTLPAHTSLMTGKFLHEHGVLYNLNYEVPTDEFTVAEAFQEKGYHTAAFVSSTILGEHTMMGQGFDVYDDTMGVFYIGNREGREGFNERQCDETVKAAVEWLESVDGDLFSWVHLWDPHTPWIARPAEGQGPYHAEVAKVDNCVGDFLEALEEMGRGDATVIFTSDHGEGLGQHNEMTHGFYLYDSTIRVPLMIIHEDLPPGGTALTPVSLADVMPALGFLEYPREEQLPCPVIETYLPTFEMGYSGLTAVVCEDIKVIGGPQRVQVYQTITDPFENVDIAKDNAQYQVLGQSRIKQITTSMGMSKNAKHVNSDETLLALGYIGTPDDVEVFKAINPELRDPHDQALTIAVIGRAKLWFAHGQETKAIELMQSIVDAEPDNIMASRSLEQMKGKSGG